MSHPHMIIDAFPFGKRLHTNPTNVCLTSRASHVVAPFNPLDSSLAARTALDIVRVHPLFEQFLSINITNCTCQAVVSFDVTAGADARKTRGAL